MKWSKLKDGPNTRLKTSPDTKTWKKGVFSREI